MKTNTDIHNLCSELASIQRMERGKLSIIRQGPTRPYFNLQRTENGKNITEYIPGSQLEQVKANISSYANFENLVKNYADKIVEKSRKERKGDCKKNARSPSISISLKNKKFKN